MQEFFYEESCRCDKTPKKKTRAFLAGLFCITCFLFAILWFVIGYFTINTGDDSLEFFIAFLVLILPSVAFIVVGVICLRIKNKTYVDYDYTVVSDSIRISKVFKETKRVPLIDFNTYHIETIGNVGSQTYYKYNATNAIRKVYCTDNDYASEDKDFYYLIINYNSEKQMLILECTRQLIANILKTTRKTVLDKELK